MKTPIPTETTPASRVQPQPAPDRSRPPRPEPVAPERSASLRDSLGEAERAEEAARQERESAAMRQPVGLD
jgi:hypothetical protein